jgi:hypothetical protein
VAPTGTSTDLLPDERLIAQHRNDLAAAELEAAPSLRLAAAEIVREGYLMHYGEPRWYEIEEADLALLAGDRMYAAGLAALADAGDTVAVGILAALIAGCAEAHAVGEEQRAAELWRSSLAMLAPGSD